MPPCQGGRRGFESLLPLKNYGPLRRKPRAVQVGFGAFPATFSQLALPATALACASRVITELGVFDTAGDCFICVARADGVNQQTIERSTAARVGFTTITAGRG